MRKLKQTIKYCDCEYELVISCYDNNPNRPAILGIDSNNTIQSYIGFTKDLSGLDFHLKDEVIIDTKTHGDKIVDLLMSINVIGPKTDDIIDYRHRYPCHKLLV